MTFSLNVEFSGLLHYVPNENKRRDVRLCVVLPEANNHFTALKANGDSALECEGNLVESPIDFDNQRVTLRFSRAATTAPGRFDYEGPMLEGKIKGAIPFPMIAGDRADRNLAVVSDQVTAEDGVRAQILIPEGVFFLPPGRPAELILPKDLRPDGKELPIELSHRVKMRVEDLDSAEILCESVEWRSPSTGLYGQARRLGSSGDAHRLSMPRSADRFSPASR